MSYEEGDIISGAEISKAEEILRRVGKVRGDSFDLGFGEETENPDMITALITNPQKLMGSLNLTEKQAENVASLITAGGAGAAYKYLSKYIGSELAGAVGGFLGGFISRKLIGR